MNSSANFTEGPLPRLAIFGAGGLGIEMLALLQQREAAQLVALLDRSGYVFADGGLDLAQTERDLRSGREVAQLSGSTATAVGMAIREFLREHSGQLEAIFLALPNLPNEFIPDIAAYIAQETSFRGVIVDALKRTSAVELLAQHDTKFQDAGILYLSGCGATPGMLSTAAVVAAQSFVEVQEVKITFGVGIANWQAYRATIREDIAHLPGYDVQRAAQLSEAEVEALLEKTNGLLHLEDMEHADDLMLERAGVCRREQVRVGGVVDTRNPQKPLSTNVQIRGITYQGREATHTFTLGDETSMAANVNGNVLGFLNAGLHSYWEHGVRGFQTAAELLPRFGAVRVPHKNPVNC